MSERRSDGRHVSAWAQIGLGGAGGTGDGLCLPDRSLWHLGRESGCSRTARLLRMNDGS